VSIYFVNDQNDARQRNFTIVGIYETGLEDYDSQYVFTDIGHVQKLSGWGLQAQMLVDTVCTGDYIMVGATGFGGDGFYSYSWSNSMWSGEGPHFLEATKDTSFFVVLSDGEDTERDTAFATIDFLDDNATACSPFIVKTSTGGGSQSQYIGGYEVLIDDYEQLLSADDRIFNALPYDLQVFKVTDRSPEIFSWLAMLDINVIIIIILMIVISIVNMTSALLIIILERQQMIGTLKALGATDGPIVRVFVVHAMVIIGKGMLIGNIIGIGFAVLQHYFHVIPLDPANYYVDTVPIELVWLEFLLLNIGVVIICFAILLIPAKYVSRITPIKSIRFS
jgi:lipoprotein-releasing system permease protein